MEFEVLTTKRLFLKKLTPEVFTYLFENCSEAEIKSQLGLTSDAEFIKEKMKHQGGYVTYDRTILSFLLVLKENNETIGRCGYHNLYSDHAKAELGYALTKEENKGKGYMSEAVSKILEYGFTNMGLNRIEAGVGPSNKASLNIIRKFGFTQEGYLRQHFVRDGEIQDTLLFSLLEEEYKKK
ncbi:GNAT family N-acetyltransferase [Flavobacterium sp.]|uniref:GNAT family N-acetyltransferase n=1 Tax=Flavobacterium sp. TaxID=239 RepID=UPI003D6AB1FD